MTNLLANKNILVKAAILLCLALVPNMALLFLDAALLSRINQIKARAIESSYVAALSEEVRSSKTDNQKVKQIELSTVEKRIEDLLESDKDYNQNNSLLKISLLLQLGLNAALALYCCKILNATITSRLEQVLQNSVLLKNPSFDNIVEVIGNDEIAQLDAAIKQASGDITKSNELRRTIRQMVAHDLRAPIHANLMSVEMLQDNESVSEAAQVELEHIQKQMEQLNRMAQNLLILDTGMKTQSIIVI